MKIISAQFDNYRSFGAPVYFEFTRNIVGLIGQNGMGKKVSDRSSDEVIKKFGASLSI